MRNSNLLAALVAALLMGGGVSAKEKTDGPKPKKICRIEQMSGRITPQRICRVVRPSDPAAKDDQPKAAPAPAREAKDGRD